jgi:predicted nicotinamide N-methyase
VAQSSEAESFVRANTQLTTTPLLPELPLHLSSDVVALWERMTERAAALGMVAELPYWASSWPGGQAVARYVLDHPETVAGKSVLDVASGSGLIGIAAALAGAARVVCNDIDPLCEAAALVNADANAVSVVPDSRDLLDGHADADVVVIGDAFYAKDLAERMHAFARRAARAGALVLVGDPGRAYLPQPRTEWRRVATYRIPVTDIEAGEVKTTGVWRLRPRPRPLKTSTRQTSTTTGMIIGRRR